MPKTSPYRQPCNCFIQHLLLPCFRPLQPEDSLFLPRCGHAPGSHCAFGGWEMGRIPMKIKASARSVLILATGVFVCFAGPSHAAGSADTEAARAKSQDVSGAPVAPTTSVKPS